MKITRFSKLGRRTKRDIYFSIFISVALIIIGAWYFQPEDFLSKMAELAFFPIFIIIFTSYWTYRSNTQVTNVFVSSQINHFKVLNKHNVINDEEYGKLLTCLLNVPKIHLQNNYAEELENLYDLLQGKILSFEQFKNRKNLILNQLAQECDKYTNFNTEELSKENSMSKN